MVHRSPQRETYIIILEVPSDLVRATFGRWLKAMGRRYGCRCKAFWPIASDAPPSWAAFRGLVGKVDSPDATESTFAQVDES